MHTVAHLKSGTQHADRLLGYSFDIDTSIAYFMCMQMKVCTYVPTYVHMHVCMYTLKVKKNKGPIQFHTITRSIHQGPTGI